MKNPILALSLYIIPVLGLRLAIFNDIHINTTYNEGCGFSLCNILGRYGADPPAKLFETMLADLKTIYKGIDAVLISGDIAAHGLAPKDGSN